ncbi:MAG: YigZ family protein [Paludibacteraceae bacterium]|nr:YigZ family protein [Paludibacteraceae bacterium]
MADTYLTINKISEGLYKEKGSKFLSFAIPVRTVEEIKAIIEEKRKLYHDARHVCFAYILGPEGKEFRANDDGEPSGTAGRPMLGVLQSNNLTNTLLVIVRYFGGTKLGTSGLINAYKESASDAIANNEIIEKTIDKVLVIHFEYPFLNEIMKIVKEEEPTILNQAFDMECSMTLSIRQRDYDRLKNKLEQASINLKSILKIEEEQ